MLKTIVMFCRPPTDLFPASHAKSTPGKRRTRKPLIFASFFAVFRRTAESVVIRLLTDLVSDPDFDITAGITKMMVAKGLYYDPTSASEGRVVEASQDETDTVKDFSMNPLRRTGDDTNVRRPCWQSFCTPSQGR